MKFSFEVETSNDTETVENATGYDIGADGILHVKDGETFIASFANGQWESIVRVQA